MRGSYERSLLLCDAQQISLAATLRFALRRLRGGGASVYLVSGYFLPMAAWGSCWRMARMAVGAVNMEAAPYSDRTRKNAPGSGVPTGLPCTHKRHRSRAWIPPAFTAAVEGGGAASRQQRLVSTEKEQEQTAAPSSALICSSKAHRLICGAALILDRT